MATIPEVLQRALDHHQAGRLAEAATLYRQVIDAQPAHATAVHLLGVVAHQTGHSDQAVELISRAIRLEGNRAGFHAQLGEVYRARGKQAEAKACFVQALRLDPKLAQAHYHLALLNYSEGEVQSAIEHCRQAAALKPDYAEAYNDLGNMLREHGSPIEAEQCYEQALAVAPNYFDALINGASLARKNSRFEVARDYLNRAQAVKPHSAQPLIHLGDLASQVEQFSEARDWYLKALEFEPSNAQTKWRLGAAYQHLGDLERATDLYRQSIALDPDYADPHFNLGVVAEEQGRTDEARAEYRRALEIDPNYVNAHVNLGAYFQDHGQPEQALEHYNRVLEQKPNSPEAHYNRGLILLRSGDFAAGWPDYHWRIRLSKFPLTVMEESLWDGTNPYDRTVLVHAEQGLGDTLQFIRYIPILKALHPHVIVRVQPAAVPILRQSGFEVFSHDEPLPHFDLQVPLLTLPGMFGTNLENIPAPIPYLFASAVAIEHWRQKLSAIEGFRIGICWQGNRANKADVARSMPLHCFAPLAQVAGVRLISLQKGEGVEQLAALREPLSIHELGEELDEASGPFTDTAAVMKNLDLVITADTSLAHLAGGLGVRTWLPLSTRADWRWMRAREDSPWYPTMRLFRQTEYGHWDDVFERIATALRDLVAHR